MDQESNPHFLHWQVDFFTLSHQGSPELELKKKLKVFKSETETQKGQRKRRLEPK